MQSTSSSRRGGKNNRREGGKGKSGRPAEEEMEEKHGGYSRHRNKARPSSRIRCSSAGKRGVEERKRSIMSSSAQHTEPSRDESR